MSLGRGLESLIPAQGDGSREGGGPSRLRSVPFGSAGPVSDRPSPPAAMPVPAPNSLAVGRAHDGAEPLPMILHEEPVADHGFGEMASLSGGSSGAVRTREADDFPLSEEPLAHEAVFQIEVDRIVPNPYQPRREFDETALQELAQSIREFGIIQPLVVAKVEHETDSGTTVEYQIIAGERRLRAARMIGLPRVPAVVRREPSKKAKLELAIIENVQRSDLNPVETARAYARLQDEFVLTQREIAQRVGKSREVVANTLRLLQLPTFIQDALSQSKINESQARVLLSVADPGVQKQMFDRLLAERVSVRRLRAQASGRGGDSRERFFEKQLAEAIGAPVRIARRGEKGKVVIQFFSDDELRAVIDRLLGELAGE